MIFLFRILKVLHASVLKIMCTHQGEKKLIKFIIDDLEVFSDDSEEE